MSPDLLQHITDAAGRALALLIDPWIQFAFQGSVFWWPYLASAFAVALIGFWLARGGGLPTLGAFFRQNFSRRIWAHPSAQADYAYYLINAVFYPLIVAPLIFSGGWVAGAIERGLEAGLGPAAAPSLGLAAWRVLYTVLFFVAYDFGRYAAHSLMHDVPLLWQFHKLHHSAEVLTPFTNFRAHPVELFVMAAIPNLVTGGVSGVLWYFAAGEIGFYSFLGAHVLMLCFNAIANLRHFQVWISFGARLNRWLISPAHHQIHHRLRAASFRAQPRLRPGGLGPAVRHALRAWIARAIPARARRRDGRGVAYGRAHVSVAVPAGAGAVGPRPGAGRERQLKIRAAPAIV